MKKILFVLFVLSGFAAKAQTIRASPTYTGTKGLVAVVDSSNGRLYKYPFSLLGSGGGGGSTDTTSLSNRINANTSASVPPAIYYLSKKGCVSDADLSLGSSTFGTDNTSAIQTVLNNASATNPITVYWDGKYSITGLTVKSNTTIIVFEGCGAILRNAANKTMIRNEHFVFAVNDSIVDKNISINGGTWNGNNAGQTAKGDPTNGFYDGMHFYGVKNLSIRNFKIYTPKTYAIHATNIVNGIYERGIVDVGTSGAVNMDGVHFDGWSKDCIIRDMWINANDDAIGINADDQYRNTGATNVALIYPFFPANTCGPVSNILIENIHLESHLFGIRLLSGISRIDNITIRNITGYTVGYGLIIDNYIPDPTANLTYNGSGNIGKVTIENFDVGITTGSYITAPIVIGANIEQLEVKGLIHRTHTVTSPAILIHYKTIGLLRITESSVINTSSVISAPLIKNEGIITELQMNSITAKNINNVLDNTGTISYISATNVRHTGATSGQGTFKTSTTVTDIVASNYFGDLVVSGSGTFTSKRGDAITGYVNGTLSSTDPYAAYTLYDDFNRADNNLSIGNLQKPNVAWTVARGTWGITSAQGYAVSEVTTGTVAFDRIYTDAGKADFTYSVDEKVLVNAGNEFEFLFRYTDSSNHLLVSCNGSTMTLFKQVATSFTQIGSTYNFTYSSSFFNIKVVTSGNSITVYKDNVSVITGTDSFNATATKVGIAIVHGTGYGNGVRFKNLILQ